MIKKPVKLKDKKLLALIQTAIRKGHYVFLKHAKQRLSDRKILDLDVLDILEGKKGRGRKRNKSKDKYVEGYQDWNYCIEGENIDGIKIRIIISFMNELMSIITVIRLN